MKLGSGSIENISDHGAVDEATSILNEICIDGNGIENKIPSLEDTEELARIDIEYLKSITVNKGNIEIIKDKLISSAENRMKMLEDQQIDLRVEFPYFFTDPDLVI